MKMKENDKKDLNYEKIFGENVKNQIEIVTYFEENLRIKYKMEKKL